MSGPASVPPATAEPGTAVAVFRPGGGLELIGEADADGVIHYDGTDPAAATGTATRLRCGVCASEDVVVLPPDGTVIDTVIVCRSCNASFSVPILAPPRATVPAVERGAGKAAGTGGGDEDFEYDDEDDGEDDGRPAAKFSERSIPDHEDDGSTATAYKRMRAAAMRGPGKARADLVAHAERLIADSRAGKGWVWGHNAYLGPLVSDDDPAVSTFYRQIGSVMNDNRFDRPVSGKRSGKLASRLVHKVPAGCARVFMRQEERKGRRYNVVVLVDTSGSMQAPVNDGDGGYVWYRDAAGEQVRAYRRIDMAADLTRLLVNGLSRHQMRFSVLTFGGQAGQDAHPEHGWPLRLKGFDDKPDAELIHYRIAMGWNHQDKLGPDGLPLGVDKGQLHRRVPENLDYAGILAATEELRGCEDEQNIVLVLADGGIGYGGGGFIVPPGGGPERCATSGRLRSGEDRRALYKAACALQKTASVICIGINAREVIDHYPNAHPVDTYEEFMRVTLRELRKCVRRG